MTKEIEMRPLGKAQVMVSATKLNVTYAYDDLVFVEHNPFLLRFDNEVANRMYLHFNVDCETEELVNIKKNVMLTAKKEGIELISDTKYSMQSNDETSEIKIHFES